MSYSYHNFVSMSHPYQNFATDNFLDFIYTNEKIRIQLIEKLALIANQSSKTLNPLLTITNLQKLLLYYFPLRAIRLAYILSLNFFNAH